MADYRLSNAQRNELFTFAARQGLDPAEFQWSQETADNWGAITHRIDHLKTGAFFRLRHSTASGSMNRAVFVIASDLDGDGIRDGIDSCPRDPLNNVAGGCQQTSAAHPVLDALIAQSDVTAEAHGSRLFVTATFTNASTVAVKNPFFEVTELTGRNVLLNADGGRGGVGATLSPDVGDGVLSPGESMTVTFRIRLRTQSPFQLFVAFHGDPIP